MTDPTPNLTLGDIGDPAGWGGGGGRRENGRLAVDYCNDAYRENGRRGTISDISYRVISHNIGYGVGDVRLQTSPKRLESTINLVFTRITAHIVSCIPPYILQYVISHDISRDTR